MSESKRFCPMVDCAEATRLISLSREHRIGLWRRLQLHFHMFICGPCTGFHRFVNEAPEVFEEAESSRRIPPALKARLRENLKEKHPDGQR